MSSKKKHKVFFRTDGGSSVGMGHIMRCLSLAEMLQQEYEIHFVMRSPESAVQALIKGQEFKLISLTSQSAEEEFLVFSSGSTSSPSLIVLDGYHFTYDYEQALIEAGHKVVTIDDLHQRSFCADVVINHAGGVEQESYRTALHTRLCLGPDYAMVREIFRKTQPEERKKGSLLLAMGGADPQNVTRYLLSLLEPMHFLSQITVVLGPAYRHELALPDQPAVRVVRNAQPAQLAALYRQSDVVLLPSSTMAYEACSVRATFICGILVDNQKLLHSFLIKNKLAANAALWQEIGAAALEKLIKKALEPSFKQEQSLSQQQLFDHQQASRIKKMFAKLQKEITLNIRKAQAADCQLYYSLANDPETRRQAIHGQDIPWEEHVSWFERKLAQEEAYLYVVEQGQTPVGQVRFDADPENKSLFVISYSLAPEARGMGLGELILQKALRRFYLERREAVSLKALVKEKNTASFRIFENLSFPLAGKTAVENEVYWEFSKTGI